MKTKILTYTLLATALTACGGGGGGGGSGSPSTPVQPNNVVGAAPNNSITVNYANYSGPATNVPQSWNRPFVSVTICNATGTCSTLNNILLDTGSYGLRIDAAQLPPGFPLLPSANDASGKPLTDCAIFASGYVWGGVYGATVKLGGETATNIPIQVYNDQNSPATPPSSCLAISGTNMGAASSLAANGILGVGPIASDTSSLYYQKQCAANAACQATNPLPSAILNPVAGFSADSNGIIITNPSTGVGPAYNMTGNLVFGVNTQSDNQLAGYTMVAADAVDGVNISVTDQAGLQTSSASSYLDTGSTLNATYLSTTPTAILNGMTFYNPPNNLTLPLSVTSNVQGGGVYKSSLLVTPSYSDFPGGYLSFYAVPGITQPNSAANQPNVLGAAFYLTHSVAEVLSSASVVVNGQSYSKAYGIQ